MIHRPSLASPTGAAAWLYEQRRLQVLMYNAYWKTELASREYQRRANYTVKLVMDSICPIKDH